MSSSEFYFILLAIALLLSILALIIFGSIRSWMIMSRQIPIYSSKERRWHYLIPTTISIIALLAIYRANKIVRQNQTLNTDQQSNRLSERGITDELVILESRFSSGHLEHFPETTESQGPNRAACRHHLRLVNIGDDQASIIKYDAIIEYDNKRVVVKAANDGVASTKNNLSESIGEFYTIFPEVDSSATDSDFTISPYTKPAIEFPVHVNSFSVMEIIAELGFKFSENLYDFENPLRADPDSEFYSPSITPDFKALTIRYVLYTASGNQVISETSPCWLLKQRRIEN